MGSELTGKILTPGDTLPLGHINFLAQSVEIQDLAPDFREIKLLWPFFWVTLHVTNGAEQ